MNAFETLGEQSSVLRLKESYGTSNLCHRRFMRHREATQAEAGAEAPAAQSADKPNKAGAGRPSGVRAAASDMMVANDRLD